MTGILRTVLGDIEASSAGITDSHDHLFLSTPFLYDQELDNEADAASELTAFRDEGGRTLVQWTPRGLGRRREALRRVSTSSGANIMAATGRHRIALYSPDAPEPRLSEAQLADAFVGDVVTGGCGLIKIGVSHERITPDESDALHAAATAHHVTGAPVAIHLEGGTAADLVLGQLLADGVPVGSIVLGHLGRNPNPNAILEAARSGAWLCLDGPSPRKSPGEMGLSELVHLLVAEGHQAQLLLGADTTTSRSRSLRPRTGPAGLVAHSAAELEARFGEQTANDIMIANPANAWALRNHE